MARRSWRNFDYLLLGALALLAAYGVTMIYSATLNTLGLEDPVQRQILFVATGLGILVVVASVDYRLLEILQYPIPLLAPVVLSLASVAAVIGWRAEFIQGLGQAPALATFLGDAEYMAAGIAGVTIAFLIDRAWAEKLDLWLARALAVACLLGVVMAVALLVSRLDPQRLQSLEPMLLVGGLLLLYLLDCLTLRITDGLRNPLYVFMLLLLGTVIVTGQVSGGSQRWLGAGTIQPSELAKILVVIVLAKFLADRQDQMESFGTILSALGLVALPMILIYLQPDLGTALTLVAVWVAMMWMAGIRFRHLLILGGIGLVLAPLSWFVLEDYMRDRLLLFLNPAGDPDSYYNVYHALISIGSGGWLGKGLTHGTQSQLHFLRVRHTDFIFAVTAEELGFLGAVAMIALLGFLLWRIVRVARDSRDTFGRLIATGIGAIIFFQAAVNIGMNLGLMPVTGIPLPFISYGGSSFVTLTLGIGLVESVAMRRKKLEFG